jgi:hypothetical protein
MWIKKYNADNYEYSHDELNFLFNQDKFYIMDNHLAAAWCWIQKISVSETYNLFHIDRHYDLLDFPQTVKTEIIDKKIEFHKLSIDDYLNLKQPMNGGSAAKMFRHDNYIGNLALIYPKLFNLGYFTTHKDGNSLPKLISYEPEIYDIDTNTKYWIEKEKQKWIVNIDLDFFFKENYDDEAYQFLTDTFILEVCKQIELCEKNISVITIALSPTFCKGIKNALSVLKIFTDYFKIDFKI